MPTGGGQRKLLWADDDEVATAPRTGGWPWQKAGGRPRDGRRTVGRPDPRPADPALQKETGATTAVDEERKTGGRSGDGSATGGSEPTKAAGAPDPRRADAMAGGSGADGPAAARLEADVDGRRG